jgi:hypothetical protein
VLELSISASNNTFTGGAFPYLAIGQLAELAATLDGFPTNSSDIRELEFGANGEGSAGGYVHLRFSCRDHAAHAIIETQIESKNEHRPETPWSRASQSAHFFAAIEPSAVDGFVKELRQLNEQKTGTAWLPFVST